MKFNKNKAFTLIEMLVVLVIMGIILAIAIPSVSKLLNNRNKKIYNTHIQMLDKSVGLYVDRHRGELSNREYSCFRINYKTLINEGFKESEIKCDGSIIVSKVNNNYENSYYLTCVDNNNKVIVESDKLPSGCSDYNDKFKMEYKIYTDSSKNTVYDGSYYTKNAYLELSSNSPYTPTISHYEYSLNLDGNWKKINSKTNLKDIADIKNFSGDIYLRSVDTVGNTSDMTKVKVQLDNSGPKVEFAGYNKQGANYLYLNFNITDSLSGPASYKDHSLKYSTTEGSYTTTFDNNTYRGYWPIENLTDSTKYYYQFCAVDKVGNKTCITGELQTKSIGTAVIAFANTPTSSQNGYLKKQTATINYSDIEPLYYYVKSTRVAKSSVATTYTCGTGNSPENCVSKAGTYDLVANTWYRYDSKPIITYDQTSTSTSYIYATIGSSANISTSTSGTVSKIDAEKPVVTINSAKVESALSKIDIRYSLTDSYSGIGSYTCSVTQDNQTKTTTATSTGCSATIDPTKDSVNYKICATDKVGNTSTCQESVIEKKDYITCQYAVGDVVQQFDYTGGIQEFTVPCNGIYKLEVWGAQGGTSGSALGGNGGYAYGNVTLSNSKVLYVGVGGYPEASTTGGYNGGGNGGGTYNGGYYTGNKSLYWYAGGGATHIAVGTTNRGELKNYASYTSEVLIVAGGGGGGGYGYFNPPSGTSYFKGYEYYTGGAGGTIVGSETSGYAFGQGVNASNGTNDYAVGNSGGGGGYYGGTIVATGGGVADGGSSYIGGVFDANTSSGINEGNGYAQISLVSLSGS